MILKDECEIRNGIDLHPYDMGIFGFVERGMSFTLHTSELNSNTLTGYVYPQASQSYIFWHPEVK